MTGVGKLSSPDRKVSATSAAVAVALQATGFRSQRHNVRGI
jgi:hypothetical protein